MVESPMGDATTTAPSDTTHSLSLLKLAGVAKID